MKDPLAYVVQLKCDRETVESLTVEELAKDMAYLCSEAVLADSTFIAENFPSSA